MILVLAVCSLFAARVEAGLASPRFADRERASRLTQKFWPALLPPHARPAAAR